jgi:hypothetical protein
VSTTKRGFAANLSIVSVLHNIYPNEVLHFSQRAKGMGSYSFFQNCFGFAMTYGGAAAVAALGWKVRILGLKFSYISKLTSIDILHLHWH